MIKQLLTLILLLFFVSQLKGQPYRGDIQFDLAVGGTLFSVPNSINVNNIPSTFASTYKFDGSYSIANPLSIGFSVGVLQFKTNNDSNSVFIKANSSVFLFLSNVKLINNKKFTLSIGTGIGGNKFSYEKGELVDSVLAIGKVITTGQSFLLNFQANWYFSKHIGVFIRPQFMVNGGLVKSFTVNGKSLPELSSQSLGSISFSFRGISAQTGISFKF